MKVQIESINNTTNFNKLPIGQVFVWRDDENNSYSFMKIPIVKEGLILYDAVDLETGALETFDDATVIIPKSYSLKIEV